VKGGFLCQSVRPEDYYPQSAQSRYTDNASQISLVTAHPLSDNNLYRRTLIDGEYAILGLLNTLERTVLKAQDVFLFCR
jgi:hypothetical protein